VLRLDRDPGKEFAGLVRHAIYQFDPRLIATEVSSINEIVSNEMWAERQAFTILRGLSVTALVLTVGGLFSVIAYTVDSRTKEFGVRVVDSRINMINSVGMELEGSLCTFPILAETLFPETIGTKMWE